MASTTLTNALSGLFASRAGIATASNNIANSNTEGYSRQRTEFAQRGTLPFGSAGVGLGVQTASISRGFTELQNQEIARNTALAESFRTTQSQLLRIDSLIAAEGSGLNDSFADFFEAAQDLSVRPTDVVARNSFLSRTNTLVARFNDLDRVFENVRQESTAGITDSVKLINDLSSEIAELNKKIKTTERNGTGSGSNDLMDQRDLAVANLSKQIEINRVVQEDGQFAVFLKNGQPLVTESASYTLIAKPSPVDEKELQIGIDARVGASDEFIPFSSSALGGGRIGGFIAAQSKVASYQHDLGLIAVRFAEEVNSVFESGFDVDGNPGRPLLSFAGSNSLKNGFSKATGSEFNTDPLAELTLTQIDSSTARAVDYEVYNNAGSLFVREKGSFELGSPVNDLGGGEFDAAGLFSFSLAGGFENGDSFVVSPFRDGAKNLSVAISDPFDIPTSSQAGLVGNNQAILDVVGLQSENTLFVNSASRGASFIGAFSQLVNQVGNDKREVDTSLETQDSLLGRLASERDEIVGVNLDEEAASLIKFQQSYQAASQVLATEKGLFEGLLSIF